MGEMMTTFSTAWELYVFSSLHLLAGLLFYTTDTCRLMTLSPCVESERVMERFVALTFVYVGTIYTALTYHNREDQDKLTRLSNAALVGSACFFVAVLFCGNASFGGLERSWMRMVNNSCHTSVHCLTLSQKLQHPCLFFSGRHTFHAIPGLHFE